MVTSATTSSTHSSYHPLPNVQINPPNLNDYSSEEESDDGDGGEARPLTHDELKEKTVKVIHRRAVNNASNSKRGGKRR